MKRWRILQLAAILVSLGIMGSVVARLGPESIVERVQQAGAGVLWMFVAYTLGTAIGALPWFVLLPRSARPTLPAAIASRFVASSANALLPVFGLGGEATRLAWLDPQHRARGLAAIVIDRLTYGVASALFLGAGVFAALAVSGLDRDYILAAAIGALAILVVTTIVGWLFVRHRFGARMHRLVDRLRRRDPDASATFGADVDRAIDEALERPRSIAAALALGVAARIVLGLEIYAGFRALDVELSLAGSLVVAAVPVALAFVGALVPSQLGLHESAQALVARSVAAEPAIAIAVVLLQRMRQLAFAAVAWAAIVFLRRRRLPPV